MPAAHIACALRGHRGPGTPNSTPLALLRTWPWALGVCRFLTAGLGPFLLLPPPSPPAETHTQFAATAGSTGCLLCAAGQFAAATGQSGCGLCSAGYFCLEGSIKATENDCANSSVAHPANYYCPAGSGRRVLVPPNYFSTPQDEASARNREGALPCPRSSSCLLGLQLSQLVWKAGDCAGGTNALGTRAAAAVSVAEAGDGYAVGAGQLVLSPFPVAFSLDPASDSALGGAFKIEVGCAVRSGPPPAHGPRVYLSSSSNRQQNLEEREKKKSFCRDTAPAAMAH